ncbi:MAG: hypothetical protein AB1346_10925 [Thermodesulfobacteriota bacterium]
MLAFIALILSMPVPGQADCDSCGSCGFGSSAYIGTSLACLSRGDRALKLAIVEHKTRYEAPSLPFLRPPEQIA